MEGFEGCDAEPCTHASKLQTGQCNVDLKLQSVECNVDAGSMHSIEADKVGIPPLDHTDHAEPLSPLSLHMSCPHHVLLQDAAAVSCACPSASVGHVLSAPTHSADHNSTAASAAEDKKLQYTLRSNPKRSRRFLDPDYALELASPLAPSPSPSPGPGSSSLPTGPALLTPAPGPTAPPAPIKKANSLFSEKARACTECGKQFPSWKALFGHMRCHPERQWRGIQPPTSLAIVKDRPTVAGNIGAPSTRPLHIMKDSVEGAASPSAPVAPQQASFWDQSDSENPMKVWPLHPRPHLYDVEESDTESIEAAYMNGRDPCHGPKTQNARGRRSKRPLQDVVSSGGHFPESYTPPNEVMDERDMADCLVMLSFAAKSKIDETSDGDSGLLDWKTHARQSSLAETQKMETKEKKSYHGRMQKSIHFLQEGESILEKWDDDYEKGSWERRSKFECSTCKKTFRSHQALGGHRASHKKVKGCFARTNVIEEAGIPEVTEMTAIALTMATTMEEPHQHQQEEAEEVLDAFDKQRTGDQVEQGLPPHAAEDMSMGQFLQFSITCNEKMEEDQLYDSTIAADKLQLKHQTSSCSSSSSIIAATAAAGTLLMHHQHSIQQPQQPKIHQCTICRRVFSTGQALGGHKRCHWGGSGMLEIGKRCPLMRQDSDGGACMGMSTSEKSSEMSRKGRQDSGSFASAEQWVDVSPVVMEKDSAHVSAGLSNKGRQVSLTACGETKVGHPSAAQNWLGGYGSSEKDNLEVTKMLMGGPLGEENNEDVSAQRGWIEALSANPRPGSKKFEGEYEGTAGMSMEEAGAGKWQGSGRGVYKVMNKGCECSSYENEEGSMDMKWQKQKGKGATAMKVEELLDLNLPAPVEEEEEKVEKQHGGGGDALPPPTFRRPLPAQQYLPREERVEESAGS